MEDARLTAGLLQCLRCARPPVAEVEVLATDKTCCMVFFHQHAEKILPWQFHQRPVKGQHQNPLHAVAVQKGLTILYGIDQSGGSAPEQGFRMGVEGDNAGGGTGLRRQLPTGTQKRLVPQMHSVEKTQSIDNSFCHTDSYPVLYRQLSENSQSI